MRHNQLELVGCEQILLVTRVQIKDIVALGKAKADQAALLSLPGDVTLTIRSHLTNVDVRAVNNLVTFVDRSDHKVRTLVWQVKDAIDCGDARYGNHGSAIYKVQGCQVSSLRSARDAMGSAKSDSVGACLGEAVSTFSIDPTGSDPVQVVVLRLRLKSNIGAIHHNAVEGCSEQEVWGGE